jgi:elongation of very long chain fatty acids protein 6
MEHLFPGNPRNNKQHLYFDKNILKTPLVLWNFTLAIFSMWGAYHMVPHVLKRLESRDSLEVICDVGCYDHPVSMVVLYFNLSKMPEFVDTIFLRLRKRPVIFLHWYHHIVTMLYCWYGNQVGWAFNCTGFFFASMNLTVHSVMYVYYAVAAMGYAKQMANMNLNIILTTGQIIQMIGGIFILIKSTSCQTFDSKGFTIATIMYSSYFLLFGRLFYDKYIKKKEKTISGEKKDEKERDLSLINALESECQQFLKKVENLKKDTDKRKTSSRPSTHPMSTRSAAQTKDHKKQK